MVMNEATPKSIDEYIAIFPKEVQDILQNLRATIHKAAPDSTEAISYQMPTFKLNGNLVHFAAYKNHIGFYPTASGIEAFKEEIKEYKNAKGSVQFPINEPLPFNLITRIVAFRVSENQKNAKTKRK